MPFVIATDRFDKLMYFCEHNDPGGFTISTDKTLARVYKSRKEAKEIAEVLKLLSGMETTVKRI
jgi:hypothetical protein